MLYQYSLSICSINTLYLFALAILFIYILYQHYLFIRFINILYLLALSILFIYKLYQYSLFICSINTLYHMSKVGDLSRWWPEGFLFNGYNTDIWGRALLHSLDCPTLPLILTLWYWLLSKAVSSIIFWVFGMTQPGIEPRSPRLLANTLLIII